MDFVIKAGVVRDEIAGVLKSDRLHLLGSCEAHVFKLNNGSWEDLTEEPVLVHLIRDNLEGVTKMLAVSTHKLIIDNVPVSSNFNVFAPSKKFIQFVCNKFDKNTDNYGFGFAGCQELEVFLQLLNRIKHAAMASLTPSFRPGVPQTPRHVSLASTGQGVPLGFAGSPIKAAPSPLLTETVPLDARSYFDDQHQNGFYNDEISSSSSYSGKSGDAGKSPNSPLLPQNQGDVFEGQFAHFARDLNGHSGSPTPALPSENASGSIPLGLGTVPEMPLYAFAERRLCDLISSFDTPSALRQPEDAEYPENTAGPIGSPIKRGGDVDADRG